MDARGYTYTMTVDQAAALLHVRPATVRRWLRCGKMHGHYLHGPTLRGWRVTNREVDRLLGKEAPPIDYERILARLAEIYEHSSRLTGGRMPTETVAEIISHAREERAQQIERALRGDPVA
ncbi:MAG TPA: helix-turn-helix domain-containing protein [Dehalococcoidia bacterium]|jgi:excisionase family DNA binding protein|nr:helix-turn-helix domain-containing protein [Dehalococcoidia bacterium]